MFRYQYSMLNFLMVITTSEFISGNRLLTVQRNNDASTTQQFAKTKRAFHDTVPRNHAISDTPKACCPYNKIPHRKHTRIARNKTPLFTNTLNITRSILLLIWLLGPTLSSSPLRRQHKWVPLSLGPVPSLSLQFLSQHPLT